MKIENYFSEYYSLFIRETEVIRKCSLCETKLDFKEYMKANLTFNERLLTKLITYWKDSRLAILCCKCRDLIRFIIDPKWVFEMIQHSGVIEVFFYQDNKDKSFEISNKMYERLIEFGILERNEESFVKKHDFIKEKCICFECIEKRVFKN